MGADDVSLSFYLHIGMNLHIIKAESHACRRRLAKLNYLEKVTVIFDRDDGYFYFCSSFARKCACHCLQSCPRWRGKCRGVTVTKGEWLGDAKRCELFPLSFAYAQQLPHKWWRLWVLHAVFLPYKQAPPSRGLSNKAGQRESHFLFL